MNIHNSDNKNHRFKISVKGLQLEFTEQLNINQNIKHLLEDAPKDSKVELKIQYENNTYKAKLEVKDSLFGCSVNSTSKTLNEVISKIFKTTYVELEIWRSNPANQIIFAPYIGGYPSYYKELTA